MIDLPRITLVCIDCVNIGLAINALQKSLEQIKPARAVLLTDKEMMAEGIEVVQIDPIKSKEQYSEFVIKSLIDYFDTDFVMVIQHDGYIINGDCWNDEFYNYDYIGAPWLYVDGKNVGNGGASLRSIHLQEVLASDKLIKASDPEDQAIGRLYRDYLIKEYAVKFPSEALADTFSFELREPKCRTFAFHGYFHQPFKPSVILKRSGACGDIVLMEPVMRYYHDKGYNVVLDIPLEFFDLYHQHYFPVKHISQFDRGRITPEKEINLDLGYEVTPNRNYVQSYFEMCGIKEKPQFKPYLFPYVNEVTKLFKKYCVVHIDNRETPHRNIYGVDWKIVERYLTSQGYTIIQIGKNEHERIGIEMNTATIGFMKFVISGCDLFIGVDSGPSHIAVAYNVPSVIMFGSVNPDYIHMDLSKVAPLQSPCDKAHCWHKVGATAGQECFYKGTDKYLQCCKLDAFEVIDGINKVTGQ